MKYTEEMILHSDSGYCMPFEEPRGKDVELSLGYGEQVHPTRCHWPQPTVCSTAL